MRDIIIGSFGSLAAIILPLLDFLATWLQIAGACGGLILLFYSIRHKRMQIEHLKNAKNIGDTGKD